MMKKILSIGLLRGILYGSILLFIGLLIFYFDPPIRYEITEQYTFESPERSTISLSILVPKTMNYQQISNLRVEGGKKIVIKDTSSLQIIIVEPQQIKDTIIKLTYDVYLPTGTIAWPGIITPRDLRPEMGIESDNPELIAKSKSIASGKTLEDARRIYNFVSNRLSWPEGERINVPTSAITAYKTKVGVCAEFAQLLTAMLRANGIPARSISGLALPQLVNIRVPAIWNHQAASHAWVEFFADGQWHFADACWGGDRHFDFCDGFHLSFGEEQSVRQIYEMCISLFTSRFTSGIKPDSTLALIGSMSNPLKFVAYASNNSVKISPVGTVKINYGYRLHVFIAIVLLLSVFEVLIKRKIILT